MFVLHSCVSVLRCTCLCYILCVARLCCTCVRHSKNGCGLNSCGAAHTTHYKAVYPHEYGAYRLTTRLRGPCQHQSVKPLVGSCVSVFGHASVSCWCVHKRVVLVAWAKRQGLTDSSVSTESAKQHRVHVDSSRLAHACHKGTVAGLPLRTRGRV